MIREDFPPRRYISTPWLLRWLRPLWAIFGNDDDGLYGDDRWRAGRAKTLKLAVLWWFRNPFHNLFFYVIGVADRHRTFYSTREWGSPGWTLHVLRCDWLWLPFISYRGRIKFYIGWRPYGAFGTKLNFSKS